ncbi:ABC transporter substrate-binding protein [Rubrivivax sp. A210]|uniref:ABC transporter substrate-binding protein n=1 Tax=Rubrivivax sp. A210 TaxID=2772301 RepID=UPI001917FE54|nr:ABC transporter substrate-binding protein [Rubrivivax sp. A210]
MALLGPVVAWAQAPIVVHHIGPFTGVLAGSNLEAITGARLFLDGLNARGGVGGRPVKLETLDDGQDAKKAAALLEQLLAEKKVLALLMPRTTPSTEALLPLIAKAGIPMIGPQSGASFVNDPPKREVFPLRASYQKEAERAIRQQHSIGVRSFGLLLADDAFGRDTMAGVDRVMKELKLAPAVIARFDNRKADVAAAVHEIAQKRPEVVLLISSSKAAAEFIKGYRGLGQAATFVSLSNTSNIDYIEALGEHKRGAIVMQVMPSPFSGNTALARDYGAAAAAAKTPPSYAGFYGFAVAKLLGQALARAGKDITPSSLVQALEGLGEIDLGGYRLHYGPGDRTGSTYVDSTIITQDGRFMR